MIIYEVSEEGMSLFNDPKKMLDSLSNGELNKKPNSLQEINEPSHEIYAEAIDEKAEGEVLNQSTIKPS
jgi:hypothetical protein